MIPPQLLESCVTLMRAQMHAQMHVILQAAYNGHQRNATPCARVPGRWQPSDPLKSDKNEQDLHLVFRALRTGPPPSPAHPEFAFAAKAYIK